MNKLLFYANELYYDFNKKYYADTPGAEDAGKLAKQIGIGIYGVVGIVLGIVVGLTIIISGLMWLIKHNTAKKADEIRNAKNVFIGSIVTSIVLFTIYGVLAVYFAES
ncbi:hypothetical protein SCORR_v1c10320 (plasmid) [Spiroplasma corruscae]|uniref:Uncharacterized protein n=1 Tax=Spiroplasma corruscae TaxID=216934 RepID=A0A222ERG3_9MOLU|nr:hypothetical protein [Spiroplasma corruscae]ASP28804.1 hypothetical protein SCORR_v1c10320 [Spiroplasma corruscae]